MRSVLCHYAEVPEYNATRMAAHVGTAESPARPATFLRCSFEIMSFPYSFAVILFFSAVSFKIVPPVATDDGFEDNSQDTEYDGDNDNACNVLHNSLTFVVHTLSYRLITSNPYDFAFLHV